MKRDLYLISEAYNTVLLREGIIPDFIISKIKPIVNRLVQDLVQAAPEEFQKVINILKSGDSNAINELVQSYGVDKMLNKRLKGQQNIQQEGVKETWFAFSNFMADIGDLIMGKRNRTSPRELISYLIYIVLLFAWYIGHLKAGLEGNFDDVSTVLDYIQTTPGILSGILAAIGLPVNFSGFRKGLVGGPRKFGENPPTYL